MTVEKVPTLNIAITLSGMLRSWNKDSNEHVISFVNFLKDNGHQVDLYGHTWQESVTDPILYSDTFKKILITPQSKVIESMREDFLFWHRSGGIDLKTTSYANYEDWVNTVLDHSMKIYGQVITTDAAFAVVPTNVYDIIIRLRWDVILRNGISDTDSMNSFMTKIYEHYWQSFGENTQTNKDTAFLLADNETSEHYHGGRSVFKIKSDIAFVMSKKFHNELYFRNSIDKILYKNPSLSQYLGSLPRDQEVNDYHGIWVPFFRNYLKNNNTNYVMAFCLPTIFMLSRHRKEYREVVKFQDFTIVKFHDKI
jgi:hypothetical protein